MQKLRIIIIAIGIFVLTTILSAMILTGLSFLALPYWHIHSTWLLGLIIVVALAVGLIATLKIMWAFQNHKQNNKLLKIIADLIEAIIFAW